MQDRGSQLSLADAGGALACVSEPRPGCRTSLSPSSKAPSSRPSAAVICSGSCSGSNPHLCCDGSVGSRSDQGAAAGCRWQRRCFCGCADARAGQGIQYELTRPIIRMCWLLLPLLQLSTGRPIPDSLLGLSEIAWAPSFTICSASEGPLAGCTNATRTGRQCLGPSFYLGTPSVVRSPTTGNLLATADLFDHGPSAACWPHFFVAHRDHGWAKWQRNATLYRSSDNGSTWKWRGWVPQHYWSSLFAHEGAVYLMGVTDDKHGEPKISRTTDDGLTWTQAVLRSDGLRYTTGATAVAFAQGRVWRAYEGGPDRASMMFSAPASADLLDPTAWRRTAPLAFNLSWIPESFGPVVKPTQPWVEGNAVQGPDGRMYNLLRLESGWSVTKPVANKALLLRLPEGASDSEESADTPALEYVSIVDMPGGSSKFTVRRHTSGVYFALTNNVTNVSACCSARNVLTLVSSRDLRTWKIQDTLLVSDEGLTEEDAWRYTAFSYVDWQFDGDGIIYAMRTSYRGGVSFHNTNRITFRVLEGIGRYLE